MFRLTYSYLKILTACIIPLVSACVVIPTLSEIDQDQIIEFHPGITHRSEVIEQIGEPNIFSGDGFDVYHLEGGGYIFLFLAPYGGVGWDDVEEVYNLVFQYDAKGLLQELRYEKSIDPNDPDLILLDNDFTGRVRDFTADGEYSSVYISTDGRLITAISKTDIVIQEVEGETREIELEQMNLDSWGYGLDCVIDLYNHRRKKQNPDFNWLIEVQDLRPLYWLCMFKGVFGVRANGAYGVTADGSGLAVAISNRLEFLSQTGERLSAPEADQEPIRGIWFDGVENHVVTSSAKLVHHSSQVPWRKTELKIRSLPSLNTIQSIGRPFGVTATAMSDDNRFFALASGSHVELWRRIKSPGESPPASDGHYELTRIIPIKPGKGVSTRGPKYLKFSPDGEYLMAVGSWLGNGDRNGRIDLWETNDGKPVVEIAQLDGVIEAAFNQNNEIVIVSGQESFHFTSRKYQSLKIWHLPLEPVKGTRGKNPSSEVDAPAIATTTEKVSGNIDITDTDIDKWKQVAKIDKLNAELAKQQGREQIEILGVYSSLVKTNKGSSSRPVVFLAQSGNQIQGKFIPDNGDRVTGTIQKNKIKFHWTRGDSSYDRVGTWKIMDMGKIRLEGKWEDEGNTTGTWKLSKTGPGTVAHLSALDSFATSENQLFASIDLSGTYVSDRLSKTGWALNKKTQVHIHLEQSNNSIEGKFTNGLDGEIKGSINGDKLELTWWIDGSCSNGTGEFTITSTEPVLEGVLICRSQGIGKFKVVFKPM